MHSTTTTQNGTDMTTPNVHEISSKRRERTMLERLEGGREEAACARNSEYMSRYHARCAEIRALDARADAARSEY